MVRTSQEALFEHLSRYSSKLSRVAVRTTGRRSGTLNFPSDEEREPSQRTRSFLFMTIAAISARRTGIRELLLIGENGQMAIHLPLTPARIGAFSTHTAHPQFVHDIEYVLSQLLGVQFTISNPFLYQTKAECIAVLAKSRKHKKAILRSVSCWRTSRQSFTHCGECIPCIIRRIALDHHGMRLAEYARDLLSEDVLSLPPDDTGRKNLTELAEFIALFGTAYSDSQVEDNFPELINPYVDKQRALAMYRRFAKEARGVLRRYRGLSGLLR